MKVVVDESLSSRVAERLRDRGHEAVHVGDLGLLGAGDNDVLAAAASLGAIVVTADTDFGGLLALSEHARPSVVLLRRPHTVSTIRWP